MQESKNKRNNKYAHPQIFTSPCGKATEPQPG